MQRSLLSALVVIAVLVPLAGCGEDEQRAITGVLTAGLTSDDPHVICEGSLSPTLLMRVYGSAAACRADESKDAERVSQAMSVDVARVSVEGARASAVVTIHGGNHDGARGGLVLDRRADGWRVSELSVGLLRSQFEASLRRMQLDPSLRTCITKKMRAVADGEFKQLAYGPDAAAKRRLGTIARRCAVLIAAANVAL